MGSSLHCLGPGNISSLFRQSTRACFRRTKVCVNPIIQDITVNKLKRCNPSTIAKYTTELVKASGVPYVQDKELRVGQNESVIATGFHVDHTEVDAIAAGLSNWNLGKLNPGDEYFAFIVKE